MVKEGEAAPPGFRSVAEALDDQAGQGKKNDRDKDQFHQFISTERVQGLVVKR
ncbi:hypothetical protein SynSYN20_01632 [Synechococcus sp. SYN20]|nr:hypothetical protein SynSYN20_01632 [Synechococcus sp. SYN20]